MASQTYTFTLGRASQAGGEYYDSFTHLTLPKFYSLSGTLTSITYRYGMTGSVSQSGFAVAQLYPSDLKFVFEGVVNAPGAGSFSGSGTGYLLSNYRDTSVLISDIEGQSIDLIGQAAVRLYPYVTTGSGGSATGYVSITYEYKQNAPLVISDYQLLEDDNLQRQVQLSVSVATPLSSALNVDVALPANAAGHVSFAASSTQLTTTVTIPAGQTSANVTLYYPGDNVAEAEQKFEVTATSSIGSDFGSLVLKDDDVPTIHFLVDKLSVAEGQNGDLTFVLDQPAPFDIDVYVDVDQPGWESEFNLVKAVRIPAGVTNFDLKALVAALPDDTLNFGAISSNLTFRAETANYHLNVPFEHDTLNLEIKDAVFAGNRNAQVQAGIEWAITFNEYRAFATKAAAIAFLSNDLSTFADILGKAANYVAPTLTATVVLNDLQTNLLNAGDDPVARQAAFKQASVDFFAYAARFAATNFAADFAAGITTGLLGVAAVTALPIAGVFAVGAIGLGIEGAVIWNAEPIWEKWAEPLVRTAIGEAFDALFDAPVQIEGTEFNDHLSGFAGNDQIVALGGDDTLFGRAGDDKLDGGAGDDIIVGGDGIDLAVYSVSRGQATITRNADGSVTIASAPDGADYVVGVEKIQFTDGSYSLTRFAGPTNGPLASNFTVGVGGWSSQDVYPRHIADVNGDGFSDIVGFGHAGVLVSYGSANGSFTNAGLAVSNFGQTSGWTSDNQFHRELSDVNGDGRADIVGFGIAGTLISLARADGSFDNPGMGITNFGADQGWVTQDGFARTVGDVNGDGKADIIGFGYAGTLVSLGNGDGTFQGATLGLANFGVEQGWTSDTSFHRTVADVNGDGADDIIGFGYAGALVALSNGDGTFDTAQFALDNFGKDQGWFSQDIFARDVADVNGDGYADIVGFGIAGAYVAYGQANGTFSAASFDVDNFGANQGWTSDNIFHRELADINNDGFTDIVGFGYAGVLAGINQGHWLI